MILKNFSQTFNDIEETVTEYGAMVEVVVEYHGDGDIIEWDVVVLGAGIDEHLATFETEEDAEATAEELRNNIEEYGLLK